MCAERVAVIELLAVLDIFVIYYTDVRAYICARMSSPFTFL